MISAELMYEKVMHRMDMTKETKEEELQEFIGEQGHFSTMFDFSQHLLTAGEHGWYEQRPFCFEAWRDALFTAQEKAASVGFL